MRSRLTISQPILFSQLTRPTITVLPLATSRGKFFSSQSFFPPFLSRFPQTTWTPMMSSQGKSVASSLITLPYLCDQRKLEIAEGKTLITHSQSLKRIYQRLFQHPAFANVASSSRTETQKAAGVYFKNHPDYKQYEGRAPVRNGSYFVSYRDSVLGDIYIDLNSPVFSSLKKKLAELKASNLSRHEIVLQFTRFFRENILANAHPSCEKLKRAQAISKHAGVMPLSDMILLGYGDCRPHALAVSALLNDADIPCEYVCLRQALFDSYTKFSQGHGDHAIGVYTAEDGEEYIADSYFPDFTTLPFRSLFEERLLRNRGIKVQYKENKYPTLFIPKVHAEKMEEKESPRLKQR